MTILIWVLLTLAAAYVLFIVGPAFSSFPFIFRRQMVPDLRSMDLADTYYEPYEESIRECLAFLDSLAKHEITVTSRDSCDLYGEFYDGGFSKTVILFHGYRTCAINNFFLQARDLYEQGYNVLLTHQRAHGKSGSKHTTLGILEQHDVISWVRRMQEHDPKQQIVLYGISMGATAVSYASAALSREDVCAMVLDCGYLSPYVQQQYECRYRHLPWPLLLPIVAGLAKLFLKIDMRQSAAKAMAQTQIPALFLYGSADVTVCFDQIKQCYDSCASQKKLLTIEGAAHTMAYVVGGQTVKRALLSFINEQLTTS